MFKKFNISFLTFFMIGKIKYAPGSCASFVTCLLFFFTINYIGMSIIFLITLILFFYSFVAINNSFDKFDDDDPQEIVIDEVVGQLLTLLAIPVYEILYMMPKLYYCICGFLLFRFFDILKPYPINYVDKNVTGAMGIMLDDIFAAFYSITTLIILFFFLGG
jgi:phosphatidylglycerophosphatase A